MEKSSITASVIIRAYNAEDTIARAIESARLQDTKEPYEIIVVDDGSVDRTVEIVRTINDPRIILVQQENQGAIPAAARGFAEARGHIIMFLDADDETFPTTLTLVVEALHDSGFAYAYGDYIEEYQGREKRVVATDPFKVPAGGIAWRHDLFQEVGGYSRETIFPEHEILLATWGSWKGAYISEPLFLYHRRDASLASDTDRVNRAIEALRKKFPERAKEIDLIRNYEPLAA